MLYPVRSLWHDDGAQSDEREGSIVASNEMCDRRGHEFTKEKKRRCGVCKGQGYKTFGGGSCRTCGGTGEVTYLVCRRCEAER